MHSIPIRQYIVEIKNVIKTPFHNLLYYFLKLSFDNKIQNKSPKVKLIMVGYKTTNVLAEQARMEVQVVITKKDDESE